MEVSFRRRSLKSSVKCKESNISIQHQKHLNRMELLSAKNKTLQETARAMIHGKNISQGFWAEVFSAACYIFKRVYVKLGTKTILHTRYGKENVRI